MVLAVADEVVALVVDTLKTVGDGSPEPDAQNELAAEQPNDKARPASESPPARINPRPGPQLHAGLKPEATDAVPSPRVIAQVLIHSLSSFTHRNEAMNSEESSL